MEKKKFLFDSLSGLIGDIAWQVSKEGHEVRYYIKDQKEADIADGFVAKSENPEKDAEWADIIDRTDIGDRWDEDSDRLHNWGILR